VFSVRAKWADIAGRGMHKAVTNHFILSFKAFPTLGSWACCNGTIVRSALRMNVCVGAMIGKVLEI